MISFHPQPIEQQIKEIRERLQKLTPRINVTMMKAFAVMQYLANSTELLNEYLAARSIPAPRLEGTMEEQVQQLRDKITEIEAQFPAMEEAFDKLTQTPTSVVNVYIQNLVREAIAGEVKK